MRSIFRTRFLWAVLLFSFLLPVDSTLSAVANETKNVNHTTLLLAQSRSNYDRLMQQGYAAARRRNYGRARSFFRQALRSRAGDRYARRAIANMNRYIARIKGGKFFPIVYGRKGTGRTSAAAVRGGCFQNEELLRKKIIPLIPSDADGVTTTAEYPSLLFYVPQIPDAKGLELVVRDDEQNFESLQKIPLKPTKQAGIVRATLSSETGKPLALNKKYNWIFSVICNTKQRDTDWVLQGSMQRIESNEDLNLDLQAAAPQEQVEIYVKNKLWENALRTIADLRRQNPNDPEVKKYWEELLKSVKLEEEVIQAPLLQ